MLNLLFCVIAMNPALIRDYKKLAIMDFTVVGWTVKDTTTGKYAHHHSVHKAKEELSQTLMAALENQLQIEFDIVERRKLKAIQEEHKLVKKEDLDLGPASEVWKLLKADRLLTGTVSFVNEVKQYHNEKLNIKNLNSSFHLSVSFKLIETSTGSVFAVGDVMVHTDSRKLRRDGFSDGTYLTPLCEEMAGSIRERIKKALRARRDEGRGY